MNFRVSFILLVLVAVVGGYVLIFELQRRPGAEADPPFFYDVAMDDITNVSVTYQGQQEVFVKIENQWFFEDTGEPVDMARWGGIPLLLTGPQAARILQEQIDNPAEYGLDPPETHIIVTVKGGLQISILLGYTTPDVISNYAQVEGYSPLYLVTSTWGAVINRLVTEPPVIFTPQEAEATETTQG